MTTDDKAKAAEASPAWPSARAKPLPGLPRRLAAPDLVPARMVNEVLYCERLMYLEWVQGEWADNFFTADGKKVHRRVDEAAGNLPEPIALADEGPIEDAKVRSVWLSSEDLGLTAKVDVVHVRDDGTVAPIEHKRGKRPDLPEGAWLPERAQVCAQVLLLREHGYRCERAFIWYDGDRRRVEIAIDDGLIAVTKDAIARARDVASKERVPVPLTDSAKCNGCSLVGICLPDEVELLKRLDVEHLPTEERHEPGVYDELDSEAPLEDDPWGLVGTEAGAPFELRRIHPARDEALPVYVQEHGARVTLTGERLRIFGRETRIEARLPNTSQLSVFGNVQITTQVLAALFRRSIPVFFYTSGGWFLGRTLANSTKNVELRLAQLDASRDDALCLSLARGFIRTKILNCRTMLRRNHDAADEVVLFELKQLARKAGEAASLPTLLGIEGSAARVYFGAFTGMLKGESRELGTFDLNGRNRRPPRDPINALLSFAYALLVKEWTRAIEAVGLDSMLGFYHQLRFGRPSLALDMMEETRPIVADSVVISVVNNGVIGSSDVVCTPAGAALKAPGRKKIILAFERRMDQLVTHPLFGYRISYRRMLEVQARLMARLVAGEVDVFPHLRTR